MISDGDSIAILSIGHPGNLVVDSQKEFKNKGLDIAHYDMRFIKPLDINLLHKIAQKHRYIITLEDGCLQGGFGSAILEFMSDNNYSCKIHRLGIPDKFIHHGTIEELQEQCGFDKDAIIKCIDKINQTELIAQPSNN